MPKISTAVYHCQQIKECEYLAYSNCQLDSSMLRERAGKEAFTKLLIYFPVAKHIAIFCGLENNAGNAYVLASLAHEFGLKVTIYQRKSIEELALEIQSIALQVFSVGIECQSIEEMLEPETDLIIDALLGIEIQGLVDEQVKLAITQINESALPVISLDVPSGLDANTGVVHHTCVKANYTFTFIAPKIGMFTGDGPDYCGEIHCCTLQLEKQLSLVKSRTQLLHFENLTLPLKKRLKNSHKGDYGNVLIIGGGLGMPGAVALTARTVMRCGAGSVTIATLPQYSHGIVNTIPEAMIWGIKQSNELKKLLQKATFCIIGPGLGEDSWALDLFRLLITSQLPMLIDASALRLLARYPQNDDNWILTPHPGEAATLLSQSTHFVNCNRYVAAKNIQQQYGGVVVLKGCGTIIRTSENNTYVCERGNPGMATAGMGDVLSGIIAALFVQGLSLKDAACCGVYAHAVAGDQAANLMTEQGLLASDLINLLPHVLNNCGN